MQEGFGVKQVRAHTEGVQAPSRTPGPTEVRASARGFCVHAGRVRVLVGSVSRRRGPAYAGLGPRTMVSGSLRSRPTQEGFGSTQVPADAREFRAHTGEVRVQVGDPGPRRRGPGPRKGGSDRTCTAYTYTYG